MLHMPPEPAGASFETPFLAKWLLRMRVEGIFRQVLRMRALILSKPVSRRLMASMDRASVHIPRPDVGASRAPRSGLASIQITPASNK
jgi:hypothetical protein